MGLFFLLVCMSLTRYAEHVHRRYIQYVPFVCTV